MANIKGAQAIDARVDFVRLDEKNLESFPAILNAIERFAPEALGQLYRQIAATPEVSHLFASSAMMNHARDKQLDHWRHLFSHKPDAGYFERAEKIGKVHAQIGLEPTWYIGGYAMVLEQIIEQILSEGLLARMNGKRVGKLIGTLVKVALVDMDIALSAYFRVEETRRSDVIEGVGNALGMVASGDFTAHLEHLPPEYKRIAEDFEAMRNQVADTLSQVSRAAAGIDTGSSEISQASDNLAMRTEQQAAALEQTSAAMEEITGTVRRTAESAAHVNNSVIEAQRDAEEGGAIVREAVTAMGDIAGSSQEIAKIIAVIDGIAFQTNLLALNAGVEAARAGDAGKGFAVVANEVRALAQRSADAASHIKELIGTSSRQVERGVDLVGRTGAALDRIVAKVGDVTAQAREISAATEAQASGLAQVNIAVAEMDKMTQQNAAMVEQSTAAARSLANEATQLAQLVSQFRLEDQVVPLRRRPTPQPVRATTRGNLALAPSPQADEWQEF